MNESIDELKALAKKYRITLLKMIHKAQSGHPGGSLSCVEILVSLFYKKLRLYDDPQDPRRDYFFFSKGHCNPPFYAILADRGLLEEEELWTLRKFHSRLQGHPERFKCPGVDFNPGSLGQGASAGTGMALGLKHQKKDNDVYVLIGDGECDEGIIWEAASAACHYKLDNLVWIVDMNTVQLDGPTKEIMDLGDLPKRFEAIGFSVAECDGHDFESLLPAFDKREPGKPHVIIAHTTKGKGVSFMENNADWHGKAPNDEQLEIALKELEAM